MYVAHLTCLGRVERSLNGWGRLLLCATFVMEMRFATCHVRQVHAVEIGLSIEFHSLPLISSSLYPTDIIYLMKHIF